MEGKQPVCKPKCDCRKDQACKEEKCICKNGAKSDDCSKECPGNNGSFCLTNFSILSDLWNLPNFFSLHNTVLTRASDAD